MINTQFEKYKIVRELRRSGTTFTFYREKKDEFGEIVDEIIPTTVGMLSGLYHESNSYIQVKTDEATQVQTNKKMPMILCLYSDVTRLNISVDDYVLLNDKKFKVTGITNIQEWNTIGDISLELVT